MEVEFVCVAQDIFIYLFIYLQHSEHKTPEVKHIMILTWCQEF
jgi:hypothetical protein